MAQLELEFPDQDPTQKFEAVWAQLGPPQREEILAMLATLIANAAATRIETANTDAEEEDHD